jgi:hypothetical protein
MGTIPDAAEHRRARGNEVSASSFHTRSSTLIFGVQSFFFQREVQTHRSSSGARLESTTSSNDGSCGDCPCTTSNGGQHAHEQQQPSQPCAISCNASITPTQKLIIVSRKYANAPWILRHQFHAQCSPCISIGSQSMHQSERCGSR